ncbi:MAG TPA: pyruvate dehydrogenase (acetyl-transferring), homodimeric type, partial [Acidimicrobiales bacterium]|nr:pyruvate dehydrogenase (acetyl-transferring), homodimeric type [Acidimicrobiales bacterium]
EDDLDHFRQEIGRGGRGLSSYPHPRLMPEFWEFPTVSMGLGPLCALYHARFNRYLHNRELDDTSQSRVWAFLGDGECDEPETLGALTLASREQLDNLIFVVSCNLQRLDGPVRGNGKIIQELEATFKGGGWNVIKVIWGREWDDLLQRDIDGVLVNQMNTTNDGQFQKYSVESGAYIREHFFGPDPRLRKLVEHLSDDDLRKLPRGGHDYRKVYAAYKAATEHEGSPTVILAHTIKGWTLGPEFEARNATHQIKKMTEAELKTFRDRLFLDIPDKVLEEGDPPYYHPGPKSEELEYMRARRRTLDGPVRGNGKIIQELEATFRGGGWNVIKVIWGREWDDLLARDIDGVLVNQMNTTNDGQFQKYSVESGAYIREHFFGPDPRLRKLVEHLSDDDLRKLSRGGHDYRKLYAAYEAAVEHEGAPTAILAKTIKGWTLGADFEARNATHQIKKMNKDELRAFRARLYLEDEIPDEALDADLPPYFRPAEGSEAYEYMMERRRALAGSLPKRVVKKKPLPHADPQVFEGFKEGSGKQEASTTMVFTRILRSLLRDKGMGARVVPIIPDEARTFGIDALFAEVKIYAPFGQQYVPVDAHLALSYKEASDGQILEEGITEAGSMASLTAAGTSYATHNTPMVPFFIFYSMFGFQRVGDLIWAFGDVRGRGFLCGATAGRTTLQGEGLQHGDGHSLVLASTVPNVAAYDAAFAYELAVIVEDGIRRMFGDEPEDVFYYLTLYNENYPMPPMPQGAEEGIRRGIYRFAEAPSEGGRRATILFSGTAQGAAREAQKLLAERHDVAAELWSATSYKALREDALSVERWNRLHPTETARTAYITEALSSAEGPVVAVTDFMKAVPDQVARWVPAPFSVLGTDGYGRSDTRAKLRGHFETSAPHVVVAVLAALADADEAKPEEVADAIAAYELDPEAPDPLGA